VETTDSIMAASGDAAAPPTIGVEDLWTVPDAAAPPTLDSIEAAAAAEPAAPPAAPPAPEAPVEPPAEKPKDGEPPKPFSFGSDEILTE
jgi:hypothetical protein